MPYSREGGKLKPRKYSKSDVMSKLQEEKVKFVDLQFTDVPGRLQHVTVPMESLDDDAFDDGVPKISMGVQSEDSLISTTLTCF